MTRKPTITAEQEAQILLHRRRDMSLRDIVTAMNNAGEKTLKGKQITLDMVRRAIDKTKPRSSPNKVTVDITPQIANCGDNKPTVPVGARRALIETQQKRAQLWAIAEPVVVGALRVLKEKPDDSNALGDLLRALAEARGLLDSIDRSEDGWQKLVFYQDNRGSCPDPSAHERKDTGALGPVVAKLRQALIEDAEYTDEDFKRLLG